MRLVAGWTLTQIGGRYGLSRQRVAQIIDSSGRGRVPCRHVSAIRRLQRMSASRADGRAGEVMSLWRQGVPREEIRVRVGVTLQAIRGIVEELATEQDRVARAEACRARRGRNVSPQFSEQELISGLRHVSRRLGHAPSGSEYARLAGEWGLASMSTVYARFGGWGPALEAAGLPRSSRPSGPVARWDAVACWQALVSVADQLGDPPRHHRYAELARERDDLPSGATVLVRLGLWSQIAAALAAPGSEDGLRQNEVVFA